MHLEVCSSAAEAQFIKKKKTHTALRSAYYSTIVFEKNTTDRQSPYKYHTFFPPMVVQYVSLHPTFKMHFTCQAQVFDTVQHKTIQEE